MISRKALLPLLASMLAIVGCNLDSIGPPRILASPGTVSFPETLTGIRSAAITVILNNRSFEPQKIESITLSGSGASSFRAFSQCGTSVSRLGQCTIQVICDPATAGSVTATMTIVDSAANSPQTVSLSGSASDNATVDVVVYGATPSGLIAALAAAKHGKQVLILEPTQHVGGMSSNGLSASDIYDPNVITGFSKDFYDGINANYGRTGAPPLAGRAFEPHVAEQVFLSMLSQQPGITVLFGKTLEFAQMAGTAISSVTMADGGIYRAKEYIDASYTGDVMAAAGVSYTVGRESVAQYGEQYAGVGKINRLRGTLIDPYVVPGDPASGLIAHVTPGPIGAVGSADKAVMAYDYRLCISSDPKNQIPFTAPPDYDPKEFEILLRLLRTNVAPKTILDFFGPFPLPNHKFDVNSAAPLSTDETGPSFAYPDASPAEREKLDAEQKRFEQAFLYFIATDPHVPDKARQQMSALGLCKDEFTDNGGWPHQLYVREARRMLGAYVLTENDLLLKTSISDPVAAGGYYIDDHINYIFNNNGVVSYEVHGGVQNNTYPIPYRILTPQALQATNLLVSVDVSASHVAYESLRVELTYMLMGQAAGSAASLAIDEGASVQDVDYGALSGLLKSDGVAITPR